MHQIDVHDLKLFSGHSAWY